jgi:hypothetical protein
MKGGKDGIRVRCIRIYVGSVQGNLIGCIVSISEKIDTSAWGNDE